MILILLTALTLGTAQTSLADKTHQKRGTVCYYRLGCFSLEGPFSSSAVPMSPAVILTKFWLYSRGNQNTPQILDARYPKTAAWIWTNFRSRRTQFIIHGFQDDPSTETHWTQDIKDELLKQGDYNVIIVDWSDSDSYSYSVVAANGRVVGAQVALLVQELINSKGVTPADFHMIGHSLGAHVAGYAGERIPGLSRITGLDPGGPSFEDTDPVVRLDSTDAEFVDVIHTDAGTVLELRWGIKQPCGHADYYPNNGYDQPGCIQNLFLNVAGLHWGRFWIYCDHMRSSQFFLESINSPCHFTAYPCTDAQTASYETCNSCTSIGCSRMGFYADQYKPPSGQLVQYYLETAKSPPFCSTWFGLR